MSAVGVSIHPPLCRRGEHSPKSRDDASKCFQSTPRLIGEGNPHQDILKAFRQVSIHPPPYRRGERCRRRPAELPGRFQSTPRFIGEGNTFGGDGRASSRVSIHPPLYRRGEPVDGPAVPVSWKVSIHPPLYRRGELPSPSPVRLVPCFNPPPALSARGTPGLLRRCGLVVSIHPRFIGEGNSLLQGLKPDRPFRDSTPRLIGEGNPGPSARGGNGAFQSTPRLIGEGNLAPTMS